MLTSVETAFGLLNRIDIGQPHTTRRSKRVFITTFSKEHALGSLELEAVLEVIR